MSRYSLVKAVVGSGRNTWSMESDPSTTRVVDSGDAAVVIERLKADNQRQIEISALEAEVAEIENLNGGVEELENATEEVSELQAAVESRLETGGLTKGEAQFVQCQLNAIARRTGLEANIPSAESFSGSAQDRIDLTLGVVSSMENIFADAWDAIVKFFKWIGQKIKNLFTSSKKTQESNEKKCNEGEAEAKENEGKDKGELPADSKPANEIKKGLGLGNKETATKAQNEAIEQLSTHDGYHRLVKQTGEIISFISNGKYVEEFKTTIENIVKSKANANGDLLDKEILDAVRKALGPWLKSDHETTDKTGHVFEGHVVLGIQNSSITIKPDLSFSAYTPNDNASMGSAPIFKKPLKFNYAELGKLFGELKKLNASYADNLDKLAKEVDSFADNLKTKQKGEKAEKSVALIQKITKGYGSTVLSGIFVRICTISLPKMIDVLSSILDEKKKQA